MDDMGEELLSTEIFGMPVPKGKTVVVGTAITGDVDEHVVHHLTQASAESAEADSLRNTATSFLTAGPLSKLTMLSCSEKSSFVVPD